MAIFLGHKIVIQPLALEHFIKEKLVPNRVELVKHTPEGTGCETLHLLCLYLIIHVFSL